MWVIFLVLVQFGNQLLDGLGGFILDILTGHRAPAQVQRFVEPLLFGTVIE